MANKRAKRRRGDTSRRPASLASTVPAALTYKVVELSTVDEGTLERAVNEWVGLGWNLDGVQFAMRESSKRPSMAFLFFTQEGSAPAMAERPRSAAAPAPERDAWERLRRLAGGDDEP